MKHTYLLIIILSLFGCIQNSEKKNSEILDGQYIEKSKDDLITKIGNFKNGKRDGYFIYFDTKGKLQAQENYFNDKLHETHVYEIMSKPVLSVNSYMPIPYAARFLTNFNVS